MECIIKIVENDEFTAMGLALTLKAKAVLESSSFQRGVERYTVLLLREAFQLVQRGKVVEFIRDGQRRVLPFTDILEAAQAFANQHKPIYQDFPFPAGGIGQLSFEFSRFCDSIGEDHFSKRDPLKQPDAAFLFGHSFAIFDYHSDRIYLIGLNYAEAQIDLEKELADLEAVLSAGGRRASASSESQQHEGRAEGRVLELIQEESDSDESFLRRVATGRDELIRGMLLQVVLSRRLSFRLSPKEEAFAIYRRLRSLSSAPYLFYLNFGAYQVLGASPEMQIKIKEGQVSIKPLAGTRRRGRDRAEDLYLEKELLSDPKERAEHLMLIDLARNDLGRVCKPASVRVTTSMTVQRFSHVMHIVSQVEGELRSDRTSLDAFRAAFPAGTVAGAPRIQAIKTIGAMEYFRRGFYAGAIAYVEPEGNLESCIAIRSLLVQGDRLVLQAGAGVVVDSKPERELAETNEKLRVVALACGFDTLASTPLTETYASPHR